MALHRVDGVGDDFYICSVLNDCPHHANYMSLGLLDVDYEGGFPVADYRLFLD